MPRPVYFASLCLIATISLPGCGKGKSDRTNPEGTKSEKSSRPTLKDEDPEVVAFVKRKGWELLEPPDLQEIVLTVKPRGRFDRNKVVLDNRDYEFISRSKTVEQLNLSQAKVTDEGLKIIANMKRLSSIQLNTETLTEAGMRYLAKCRSLEEVYLFADVAGGNNDREIHGPLAALPKLKLLYFSGSKFPGEQFSAFTKSKSLRRITFMGSCGLTDNGCRHLAKIPNLEVLRIGSSTKLTSAGIRAIAAGNMPTAFDFSTSLLNDDLLKLLIGKGWLHGPTPEGAMEKRPATADDVKRLYFQYASLSDKGVAHLMQFMNLESIHLKGDGITDISLKRIASLARLKELDLREVTITPAGIDSLAVVPLKEFELHSVKLNEDHLKSVGRIKTLSKLAIWSSKIDPTWVKHPIRLQSLKELNLHWSGFDDDAVEIIQSMKSLEKLNINGSSITDKGLMKLLNLPKLKSVYAYGTKTTKAGREEFKKRAKQKNRRFSANL